jgi:NitT/TauT family transport system substrate-binding protein
VTRARQVRIQYAQEETIMTTPLTRRTALLAAAGALGAAALAAPAIAQDRRKVTMVYGVQTIDGSSEGFFASIPIGLGFYAEEGLDVDLQTMAGAGAADNVLASGQAQIATHGTGGLFGAVGHGLPMKAFICQVPDDFTSIGVLKSSKIETVEQLKGKTIGVSAVNGAPVLLAKAVMRRLGWDLSKDVQFLAVGTALPALDALRRGQVDALVLWDTIFALFEFHGAEFRYFRPDPFPQIGFTHATYALNATIEKDPELIAKMSRALAKSLVIMASAPQPELAKLHFKVFPASKPTGMGDADVMRLDKMRYAARVSFMRLKQRVFDRTEKLGDVSDEAVAGLRDLLFNGGEIPKALPVSDYFTRQFLPEMNNIDFPALIARGRALKV